MPLRFRRTRSSDERPSTPTTKATTETAIDAETSFEDLGVAEDLVDVLADAGVTSPFPVQELAIPPAMTGRDVSGKARTGSGKTLAFGLPLIERTETAKRRRPTSLILVPTRELATQVAEALTPLAAARGLWLTAIYGGVSMSRQINALQAGVDIVIGTPGRINDLLERDEMSVADVSFLVIDEADQMADMGFLPQVRRILDQIEGRRQTLLFSATLDGAIGALVRDYQHDPVECEVESHDEDPMELTQRFIGVAPEDRVAVTADIVAGARRALIFCSTTRGADRLVKAFEGEGLRADTIHGRRSQAQRERALAAFSNGKVPILVATNVAARGIHVDDVEVVVHYDAPEDTKVYLHRSGRTARAGAEGLVVTLVVPELEQLLERLQRDVGTQQEVVTMRPRDPRLADLRAWEPPQGRPCHDARPYSYTKPRVAPAPRGRSGGRTPARGPAPRPAGRSSAPSESRRGPSAPSGRRGPQRRRTRSRS
ncbi:MAG: DEAD/DEAH box helicase [Dehalococcoidia bacterium]